MVIISKTILLSFSKKYASSIGPLNAWYEIAKNADWANFAEMRRRFNSVDAVGNDRFVFNIKGNDYRLVAMIHFDIRIIYIRFVGNHNEYDKIDCKTI